MTWTHLDTFSGIGGFALAASWTGRIQTVMFCERDAWCRRVLAKHWPGVPIDSDIRALIGYGRIDLITGGFPCQPWSAAGKQRGVDDHRDLWPELARTIRILRPRWVLAGNVAGIVSMEGGLDRVLADLGAAGYATRAFVVPAAAVGAYHRRDRVWIVAHDESARPSRSERTGGDEPEGALRRQPLNGGTAVAHATDGGLRRGSAPRATGLAAQRGQDDGHAAIMLRQGIERHEPDADLRLDGRERHAETSGIETLSAVGLCVDGLPAGLLGRPAFGPDWEAGIPRVTAHEVDRVNKLKALGNAIVPQVAYELLMMMLAVDDQFAPVPAGKAGGDGAS